MKQLSILAFIFISAVGCAKESTHYSAKKNSTSDPFPSPSSQDELLLTELDDMKNLFPFKETLDPKDPSHCIETFAKQQQDEFVKEKDLIDLEFKDPK